MTGEELYDLMRQALPPLCHVAAAKPWASLPTAVREGWDQQAADRG